MKHHRYPDHIVEHIAKALWEHSLTHWDDTAYQFPAWDNPRTTSSQKEELYRQAHCVLETLQHITQLHTVQDVETLPPGAIIQTATGDVLTKLSPLVHDWQYVGQQKYTELNIYDFPLTVLSFGPVS